MSCQWGGHKARCMFLACSARCTPNFVVVYSFRPVCRVTQADQFHGGASRLLQMLGWLQPAMCCGSWRRICGQQTRQPYYSAGKPGRRRKAAGVSVAAGRQRVDRHCHRLECAHSIQRRSKLPLLIARASSRSQCCLLCATLTLALLQACQALIHTLDACCATCHKNVTSLLGSLSV